MPPTPVPTRAPTPTPAHSPTYNTTRPADLILTNARVFSDPLVGRRWSEAVSIRGGDILSVGSRVNIEKDRGPATRVIDLKGKVVLPGFNDCQVHVITGGLSKLRIDLTGVTSIAALQQKLRAFASANPSRTWIIGHGWDEHLLQKAALPFPSSADIDAAISDHPVFLWDTNHRAAVLNTKAIDTLNLNRTSTDPNYQRNEKGEFTGVLFEKAAVEMGRVVDSPTYEEMKQAWVDAQDEAAAAGITSIQGGPIRGEAEVRIVEELWTSGKLKVRYAMWGDLEHPQEFAALREKFKHLPEEFIQFEAVKGFVDGVLASRTAALSEPYSDYPKTKGEPLYSQAHLNELVVNANRMGLPVVLHAIGDRAVSMSIAAFANARKQLFNSRIRNRIDQAEVVSSGIFPRMAEFNIVVGANPSHLSYENEKQSYNDARLGKDRVRNAFAWHSFLSANAHLAFGSDWPVMPLNPMIGLFSAVFRQHFDGRPIRGWQPAQKISMESAINAYTLGSAYATREEHVKGSIRDGKYADLVVLERDPFRLGGRDLLKNSAVLTILNGKIVYERTSPMTIEPARAAPTPR